jgi:Co/Zn/Cd efflux system component
LRPKVLWTLTREAAHPPPSIAILSFHWLGRHLHGRGAIGVLALAANAASILILMRYKDGDANVRSVWLCSRNDAIGNVAVMVAALTVWGTATKWPDLLVAAIMAGLFLNSSVQILQQSFREMREARLAPAK